jgi:hypothetical protein
LKQRSPFASFQRSTDLVVPLLGSTNALPAVKDPESVASENGGETVGKRLILGSVGKKDFSGLHRPSPERESCPF